MYNNVLLSYRSFLLTVSSIASCISNCTIVGFVSRPCKKMAQQGFPFSHLETACWAISVERLYRYLPTCPASYKKQTDDNTSGKLPVRSIALLEVPASIFPISRSETSHILFCSYELLCFHYHAMQFHILTRQGGVNAYALARWTHSVFRACGVSCASFLLSAAGGLIEYVHVYTLHKLTGVQPMVTVQCSFAS